MRTKVVTSAFGAPAWFRGHFPLYLMIFQVYRPKIEFETGADREMQTVAVGLTESVSFFGENR